MQILDNILGHIRTRLEAGLSGKAVMGVGTWPGKVNSLLPKSYLRVNEDGGGDPPTSL